MRQSFKHANAKAASGSALACAVLICGAMFGMAAQTGLLHLGLDFGSVRDDLIVGATARPRSALAWWAWWLLPLCAFFIGPLSVVLTRWLVANWWRFRAARSLASAALVLALAAVGDLPAGPSTLDVRWRAVASLVVVVLSALLAWLGAHSLGKLGRETVRVPARAPSVRRRMPARASDQVRLRIAPPRTGGGSAAGAPFLRMRQRHALVSRFTFGRLALIAMLAVVVSAAVVGLSGIMVLIEHATPSGIRYLVAWSGLRTSEPSRAARAVGMAAVPPPAQVAQVEPPGMVIDGVRIPESELTFARGYLKRQALIEAQRASVKIVAAAERAEARIPAKLKHVASLRPVRYGRIRRHVAHARHTERRVERNVEQHGERHDRVHKEDTGERRSAPRHPDRAHDRRRPRGHDRFALEPRNRVARF